MGYTVGWNSNCTGRDLNKSNIIMKFKKLCPKAKVEINKIYGQLTIEVGDLLIAEWEIDDEMYREIDIDFIDPSFLFNIIYLMTAIGCKVRMEDKITEKDVPLKKTVKRSNEMLKKAGCKFTPSLIQQTIKILYSK